MKKSTQGAKAEVTESKIVYQGKVFQIAQDTVREPNGVKAVREVVRHSGSAVILAVDDAQPEPRVLLEEQFRYAANDTLWEVPAGRVDPGESPLQAAQRELIEETGFTAKRWKPAFEFYASPGFLDEKMHVFLAQGLKAGEATPEEDEKIKVRFFSLSAALRMCQNGKIHDAKTMTAVFWFHSLQVKTNTSKRRSKAGKGRG